MTEERKSITRFAVEGDERKIFDLLMEVYNNNYPKTDLTPATIAESISDWVVCVVDDNIVGTAKITERSGNGYSESLAVDPSMRGRGLGKKLESTRLDLFNERDVHKTLYSSCRCLGAGIASVKLKEGLDFICSGFQPNREMFGTKRESLVIEFVTKEISPRQYQTPKSVSGLAEIVLEGRGIKRTFVSDSVSGNETILNVKQGHLIYRLKRTLGGETYYAQVSGTAGYSFEEVMDMINRNGVDCAEYLQVDVPMNNSNLVFQLDKNGFKPTSYLLSFVDLNGQREDVVEMVRLKEGFVLPDLKQINLPEKARKVAEYVLNMFGDDNCGYRK